MPEQVLYMRGVPTSPAEMVAHSSQVQEDLKAVAGLQNEQVDAIRERLEEAAGFLSPKAMYALLNDVLQDKTTARSVQRVVLNVKPDDLEEMLKTLSSKQSDDDFPLNKELSDKLHKILPNLIQPYSALAKFEKADRLATLTGQQLETIELICDLRPIFDEDRENIEGMMPYTRLHIVTTGVDGLPNAFEAELTQQQVSDLAEKAAKAKEKVGVLRDTVTKWIPGGLPDLPLTRILRKEASDA